ncbi:MAG: HAD-IB family hydrolase [Actinobacteria bacterium]|nr:HAD-IB family hydrolase [Actinomycetota bacterium]
MEVVVAAFDVDNTITVRDCVVPFMRRTMGTPNFLRACVSSPVQLVQWVLQRDRDSIKAYFVNAAFAGRSVDEIESDGVDFASDVAESWMRADVAARMRWHQEQGHVVVMVSASLEPYLVPFGDLCEVDAVLCTQLEVVDGRYTGALVGQNCRGEEKVKRLHAWMTEAGIPASSLVYAYGDSSGDTALLAAARIGVLVKKSELEEVAP